MNRDIEIYLTFGGKEMPDESVNELIANLIELRYPTNNEYPLFNENAGCAVFGMFSDDQIINKSLEEFSKNYPDLYFEAQISYQYGSAASRFFQNGKSYTEILPIYWPTFDPKRLPQ